VHVEVPRMCIGPERVALQAQPPSSSSRSVHEVGTLVLGGRLGQRQVMGTKRPRPSRPLARNLHGATCGQRSSTSSRKF